MRRKVVFTPLAEQDLDRIDDFIASESPAAARAFVLRVERQRERLGEFPESGRLRPELGDGIRTLILPREGTIAYRVEESRVDILRVFYGGQDVDAQMRRGDDDD